MGNAERRINTCVRLKDLFCATAVAGRKQGVHQTAAFLKYITPITKNQCLSFLKILRLKIDVKEYNSDPGHKCSKCGYL